MKKNNVKRIVSLLLALVLCFSFATSASAAEISTPQKNTELYTFEVTKDGTSLVARSSVSGYNQKSITTNDHNIVINCNGSGAGGLGITIETSCSQTYEINYAGSSTIGYGDSISGKMTTNDHKEFHGKWQDTLTQYVIGFSAPNGRASYFVKVWIYG